MGMKSEMKRGGDREGERERMKRQKDRIIEKYRFLVER